MNDGYTAQCENCRSNSGVVKAVKLDPVNFHPTYRRLCGKCRTRLGYSNAIERFIPGRRRQGAE